MCLGDVFNRNKSSAPQAPPTDVTDGEQVTIDQSVTSGRQSSNRTSGGRKGASNPNSGASRARARASTSRGRTGTPSSSRGGGRSRSRGGGRGR